MSSIGSMASIDQASVIAQVDAMEAPPLASIAETESMQTPVAPIAEATTVDAAPDETIAAERYTGFLIHIYIYILYIYIEKIK